MTTTVPTEVSDDDFAEILNQTRQFVRNVVVPRENEILAEDQVPDDIRDQAMKMGLFGYAIPQEWGGLGLNLAQDVELAMELGYTSLALRSMFGTNNGIAGQVLVGFGTDEQKSRWLEGIASGDVVASFALTEPGAGSNPSGLKARAVRDGDGWVINGRKYFSSNASVASFFIVVAITDPDVPVHRGASTFLIPAGTPGVNIEATHHLVGSLPHEAGHSLIHYDNVRVPASAMLGEPGHGFEILQARLAGGRIHHAMRSLGLAQRALEMMAHRAKSRFTQGSLLADKQLVQEFIADSYTELLQFRLTVLHAAWLIDTAGEHAARKEIGACKILASSVLKSIGLRAIQVHGAMGMTEQMPLINVLLGGVALGLADGPTEAHKVNLARMYLKDYQAEDPEWPSEFADVRIAAAKTKYGDRIDRIPALPRS